MDVVKLDNNGDRGMWVIKHSNGDDSWHVTISSYVVASSSTVGKRGRILYFGFLTISHQSVLITIECYKDICMVHHANSVNSMEQQ